MVSTRGQLAVILAAAVLFPGCQLADPAPDFDDTPTVALLIASEPLPNPGAPPDSGLYATLVTTGTPYYSPYLRAEHFEMRRASDGARFAWRPIDTDRAAIGAVPDPFETSGNYFLPRQANAAGLGSDSIAPGEVYELIVEAGRHVVRGRTRVPGPIEVVREPADGDTIVRWRRVPGAADYTVGLEGEGFFDLRRIADTAIVLRRFPNSPGDGQGPDAAIVVAFDSNTVARRSDFGAERGGVTGAWGVFGSFTWTRVELPPPPAVSASR